jgi:predicted small lipoprotein YifL
MFRSMCRFSLLLSRSRRTTVRRFFKSSLARLSSGFSSLASNGLSSHRFLGVYLLSSIAVLALVALSLAGCCGPLPIPPIGQAATASPTVTVSSQNPTPVPTSPPKVDAPTPARPLAPVSPPPAPVSTPVVDLQDLSIYQPALKPEFGADVEAVPDASRYFIQVALDPNQPADLIGVERVRYTNTENVPLDALYFRLYPNLPGYGGLMTVDQVILDGMPVEPTLEAGDSALRVPLDPQLVPGDLVDVTLQFRATLPTDTSAGYGLYAYADDVYALAGFYPTIPVYDDEGWNVEVAPPYGDATFTDVAFYQVRLTVPDDLIVVTSGSTLETEENAGGTRTWVAVGGPMRDFYVAMSADYEVVSQEVDGTLVSSYYRSAQDDGGRLALRYATDALHIFDERFGPYPYTELDVVATPTNAGGIEYPGAIVIAQGLYNQEGGFFEMATAHEVAHQWWYGLVGNDQLDEPWLDEALTNYSAFLYFEKTAGQEAADLVKQQVFEGPYRTALARHQDRAVAGPVASFNEQDYGAIVYGKGPLFFDALRTQLGDEAFFAALRAYLKAHYYGVAYPDDLITAFEETSGQQIDDLYEFWIEGK